MYVYLLTDQLVCSFAAKTTWQSQLSGRIVVCKYIAWQRRQWSEHQTARCAALLVAGVWSCICSFFVFFSFLRIELLPHHHTPCHTRTHTSLHPRALCSNKGRLARPLHHRSEVDTAMKASLTLLLCALVALCRKIHCFFLHQMLMNCALSAIIALLLSLFSPCSRGEITGEQREGQQWWWRGRGFDRGRGQGNETWLLTHENCSWFDGADAASKISVSCNEIFNLKKK